MPQAARRKAADAVPEFGRGGTIHLRAAFSPTAEKIEQAARRLHFKSNRVRNQVTVKVNAAQLPSLADALKTSLARVELEATRVCYQAAGQRLAQGDYLQALSLADFLACKRGDWLTHANWLERMMRESRLTTHFQPIVFSRNTAVVFGHECLLRGLEAGELVAADELLMLARATGLVFELDHAARRAALFASAERKLNGKIFINVSLLALHHTEAFLRSLISAMEEFGLHRDQCVLEVIDTERLSDIGAFRDVLARLRTAQFEIALDDLGPSYSSLELIRGLRPDYIKLAYDAIHAVDSDPFKATIAEKLFEGARQYGARIIAECVESEGEYSWVRDHGADFIQGFYFARPATVPRVRLRLPVA